MKIKRIPWVWLLTLIIGFGLGLTYAWVISPVQYIDAEPQALRDDFKDHFRSAIAAAYAANPDLQRARARLALLNDSDSSQALTAQAQRMLAAGESPEIVQQVAMLASALRGQITLTPLIDSGSFPTQNSKPSSQPSSTLITPVGTFEPTALVESTSTPIPVFTPTPRPSRTPTPTLGAPFQLVGQDTFCDLELAEGLLQIIVTNASRKQISGAEIIITWNNGEEHIYTGLKPELGNGYADFLMSIDTVYSVRMADGGTPASELSAPPCTNSDGSSYQGGLRITFQQP